MNARHVSRCECVGFVLQKRAFGLVTFEGVVFVCVCAKCDKVTT